MSTLVPSLLTLLGVVVGAFLQLFISRRVAREGKYLDKRVESYVDYMTAIGKSGRPGVPHEEAELEQNPFARNRFGIHNVRLL
jgi:hypothetical protein